MLTEDQVKEAYNLILERLNITSFRAEMKGGATLTLSSGRDPTVYIDHDQGMRFLGLMLEPIDARLKELGVTITGAA